jgi:dihydroflavonol-4-reductase
VRVLVTGANGHIGCNLLPMLVEAGHAVVPFVRESSDTQGIDHLGLTYARGDVRDAGAVIDAADACEAIIHMAAVYSFAEEPELIMRPAVEGAQNVIRAAKAHGIRRVVYTSSAVSVGGSHDRTSLDESDWNDETSLPYSIAKRESERLATRLAAEAGVDVIILNPTGIIGPGDYRITPSSQLLVDYLTKRVPTAPGGLSYVDVRDVARAHLRALDEGAGGERHILSAINLEQRELGRMFGRLFGVRPVHLPLPRSVAIGSGVVGEAVFGLFGAKPPFSSNQAREYAKRWCWFDGGKAERVFGLEYMPFEDTLRDSVRWLLERGAYPEKLAARLSARLAG